MAIFPPGIRNRRNKKTDGRKRTVVAVLSLTAMVDMFTVLTIFLLQNYNVTGQAINIPQNIQLPKASQVKDLKPAHVVSITPEHILLDDVKIIPFLDVKEQKDWMIPSLKDSYARLLKIDEDKKKNDLNSTLKEAVRTAKSAPPEEDLARITLQADKAVDFLTVKKIMYTLTEAGAIEINFAVIQKDKPVTR